MKHSPRAGEQSWKTVRLILVSMEPQLAHPSHCGRLTQTPLHGPELSSSKLLSTPGQKPASPGWSSSSVVTHWLGDSNLSTNKWYKYPPLDTLQPSTRLPKPVWEQIKKLSTQLTQTAWSKNHIFWGNQSALECCGWTGANAATFPQSSSGGAALCPSTGQLCLMSRPIRCQILTRVSHSASKNTAFKTMRIQMFFTPVTF